MPGKTIKSYFTTAIVGCGIMERNVVSARSLEKAVSAARHLMKSRTGAAIIKQSYVNKHNFAEKTTHMMEEMKDKELRRLVRDKKQFIMEQDEKFHSPSTTRKTKASKSNTAAACKITVQIPSENDFPLSLSHLPNKCEAISDSTQTALCRKKSSSPHVVKTEDELQKKRKAAQPCSLKCNTQVKSMLLEKDGKRKTEEQFTLKKNADVLLEEQAKRSSSAADVVRTTFCDSSDRIANWIKEVDAANKREETEEAPLLIKAASFGRSGKDLCSMPVSVQKELDAKSTEGHERLRLPKINTLPSSKTSPRPTLKRYDSLHDPRFTKLMKSLTPVSKPLKLPNIPKKDKERSF